MKLLYIATSFPEPSKGATIYTDLAEALLYKGHEVTVVVAEQAKNLKKTKISIERGLSVLRIVTGNYYNVSYLEKGITTLLMPLKMKAGIARNLKKNMFDFILFESPPVTNSSLVNWAKKKFNCPSYLMLKDIFPQNAVDLGIIKKNSLLHRYFARKEQDLYNSANIIGCMSKGNLSYIKNHYSSIKQEKLEIFPNTKRFIFDLQSNNSEFRKKHSISSETCVFLFGGNMGKPQYIDLLCDAVINFQNRKDIFFVFVGRGTERYKLVNVVYKHQIQNALIIDDLHREEYDALTKECDIGLIVLDPRFTIPNYPSRILTYFEFSKPVLAATDNVTDFKDLIISAKCGEWVWSGDKEKFFEKIESMSKSDALSIMGQKGREYAEVHFNVQNSVRVLEKHFD